MKKTQNSPWNFLKHPPNSFTSPSHFYHDCVPPEFTRPVVLVVSCATPRRGPHCTGAIIRDRPLYGTDSGDRMGPYWERKNVPLLSQQPRSLATNNGYSHTAIASPGSSRDATTLRVSYALSLTQTRQVRILDLFTVSKPVMCAPRGWTMARGRPQASCLRQVESHLRDMGMAGLASAWAMARRRPKDYRRKLDAATRCSVVRPHN